MSNLQLHNLCIIMIVVAIVIVSGHAVMLKSMNVLERQAVGAE